MSEEALQIAEKRKDTKGKGEKENYTHLNAEFQRIARRDKKAFLSDQCKEIEEKNKIHMITLIDAEDAKMGTHNKRQKWYGPTRSRKY